MGDSEAIVSPYEQGIHIPAKTPVSIPDFITAVNSLGVDALEVRTLARKLSAVQLSALRSHPKFQSLLDSFILRAFLLDEDVSKSRKWAYDTLRDATPKAKTRRAPAVNVKILPQEDHEGA